MCMVAHSPLAGASVVSPVPHIVIMSHSETDFQGETYMQAYMPVGAGILIVIG